jgi:TusA-related sulfurtransferase
MSELKLTIRPDKTLDCVGSYCPVPLIQTRKSMDTINVGDVLEVLADDPAAEEDIKSFAKRTGHVIVTFEKKEDYIRFLIMKKGEK